MKASIIVITYNQLERTTRPCIESVLNNTDPQDFELIVIDNASHDETPDYLETLPGRYPLHRIKIQLNKTNKGFSGGNNDGIRLSSGDHVVLLNNDTLVPPGWLGRLLAPFATDRRIGMLGPISNSVGNEQRVNIAGLDENNFQLVSRSYTEQQRDVWFSTRRLGFFCVAILRGVLDEIGLLDEGYGLGMFEDDDYCIRVLQGGYVLAIVEDCFVFHKGSVSFGKLADHDYAKLFKRNRHYFSGKHGVDWTLSDVALAYTKKLIGDMNAYLDKGGRLSPELQRIEARLGNMEHLLVQIRNREIESLRLTTNISPQLQQEAMRSAARRFAKRAMYKLHTELLHGTWPQRKRFIKTGFAYLRHRIQGRSPAAMSAAAVVHRLQKALGISPGQRFVVLPATVDFGYMTQRPQQIAMALAKKGYRVIYGTLNHKEDHVEDIVQVAENLYLMHQHLFPYLSHILPKECGTYYCMWPNNIDQCQYIPHNRLLYDYMDDLSLLDVDPEECRQAHWTLLQKADLITVSAKRLKESIPEEFQDKTLLLPNGVSEDFIACVSRFRQSPSIPHQLKVFRQNFTKVVGYYGAIAPWFDFDLINAAATRLPEVGFVFIGPVFDVESRVAELRRHANILFYPRIPHDELVPWLMNFDVATIPFVKNAITHAVSPVKLFEYMAAGKPVVSTDIEEARLYRCVLRSDTQDDYVAMIEKAFTSANDTNYLEVQREELETNTWEYRADELSKRI